MTLNKCTEQELYSWIKKNFIKDLALTTQQHSRYDCYSDEFNLDIELKCRRKHYNDLIIEKKKYDALMFRCNTYETIPVYINSTPKGIWAFYIADIRMSWEEKMLTKQTDFSNHTFINKKISYLRLESGVDLIGLLE
jgi:hypothetical protein